MTISLDDWPGVLTAPVQTYGSVALPPLDPAHIVDVKIVPRTCRDTAVDYVALAHTDEPAGSAVIHWTCEPDGQIVVDPPRWYWAPNDQAAAAGLRYAEQKKRLGLAVDR